MTAVLNSALICCLWLTDVFKFPIKREVSSEVDPASFDLLTVPSFLAALHLYLVHFGFDINLCPCDFRSTESTVSGTLTGVQFKSV